MYIAIDLGAESGRVIAGDLKRLEVIRRFPSRSVRIRGRLFWDAPAIYAEIIAGLTEAFARHGDAIRSVGIDTWGVDYALLDANGDILGNPFHYRDDRNDGIMEAVRAELGDRRIYEATGIQFLPFNTIYQLSEEVTNRSARLGIAESFLTIPDLLNYWLCGVKANEFSNATTTGLYDPTARDWAWELIDELGIPRRIFGKVVPSGTVLGELSPEVRAEIGAPAGVKVVAPACHDTGSAVAATPVATGTVDTGTVDTGTVAGEGGVYAYLSSGTWSLLGVELDEPLISDASREANFTNEGGAGGGYRFLKNIMGLWILQECRKDWAEEGADAPDYGRIVELAREAGPAAALIDVDDPRFLKPGRAGDSMTARVAAACAEGGRPSPAGIGETARVILESLASRYAENIAAISRLTGEAVDTLHIIGGGSQNDLLNQLTADAAGIEVCAGPVEATALGNMLMQELAAGELSSIAEGRGIIGEHHPVKTFYPQA
jgi:rhamnulokinase